MFTLALFNWRKSSCSSLEQFLPIAIGLALVAGGYALADVVIDPSVLDYSSQATPAVYWDGQASTTVDGSGLSNASSVVTGSGVPDTWPTHAYTYDGIAWMTGNDLGTGTTGTHETAEGGTGYITYQLPANYNLTGIYVWNYVYNPNREANGVSFQLASSAANADSQIWMLRRPRRRPRFCRSLTRT